MNDLSSLVSEDSRLPIERLRRVQLWALADRLDIPYPTQAPKTDMLKLLEAHQIDLSVPIQGKGIDWQVINAQDANGAPHTEIYPVIPEHHTNGKGIDYGAAIEANAKRNENLSEDELFEETRRTAKGQQPAQPAKPALAFPLDKLLPWQLNHMCKDAGIDPIPKTKEDMLAALEGGSNGQNAAERGQ